MIPGGNQKKNDVTRYDTIDLNNMDDAVSRPASPCNYVKGHSAKFPNRNISPLNLGNLDEHYYEVKKREAGSGWETPSQWGQSPKVAGGRKLSNLPAIGTEFNLEEEEEMYCGIPNAGLPEGEPFFEPKSPVGRRWGTMVDDVFDQAVQRYQAEAHAFYEEQNRQMWNHAYQPVQPNFGWGPIPEVPMYDTSPDSGHMSQNHASTQWMRWVLDKQQESVESVIALSKNQWRDGGRSRATLPPHFNQFNQFESPVNVMYGRSSPVSKLSGKFDPQSPSGALNRTFVSKESIISRRTGASTKSRDKHSGVQMATDVETHCIEAAIQKCAKTHNWWQAVELLQRMQRDGPKPTARAYTSVITALGKCGMAGKAAQIFKEMKEAKIEPTIVTFNSLINACARGRNVQLALQFLQEMKDLGIERDVISYSSAMSACEKSGEWQQSLNLFRQMKKEGVEPDVITYSAAISACEKGSDHTQAMSLLQDMKAMGIHRDIVTFNAAISACEKGGQYEKALTLLSDMEESGIEPDVISYSAAISTCGKGQDWKKALELLRLMQEKGVSPNVVSYSAAISACGKAAQWENAVYLLREMKERNVRPNVVTYSACISACEKAGKWKEAMTILLNTMRRDGIHPDTVTYSACITACDKSKRWEEALALLEDMKNNNLMQDTITYNAIISACEGGGQDDYSAALFYEAFSKGYFKKWKLNNQQYTCEVLGFPLPTAKASIRLLMRTMINNPPTNDVTVITGSGPSQSFSGVLNPGIQKLCKEGFSPPLEFCEVANNPGRLIINKESIIAWGKANPEKAMNDIKLGKNKKDNNIVNLLPSFIHIIKEIQDEDLFNSQPVLQGDNSFSKGGKGRKGKNGKGKNGKGKNGKGEGKGFKGGKKGHNISYSKGSKGDSARISEAPFIPQTFNKQPFRMSSMSTTFPAGSTSFVQIPGNFSSQYGRQTQNSMRMDMIPIAPIKGRKNQRSTKNSEKVVASAA